MTDNLNAEMWADSQFSKAAGYLSSQNVRYTGVITLAWLAAPYIALWRAKAPDDTLHDVWVICGQMPTDVLAEPEITGPRAALRGFGTRWQSVAAEHVPDKGGPESGKNPKALERQARMLLNIADDESLWPDDL
ncbi:DUF4826 domain-containing protein [Desulfonema ishimotonii]|uniref:DUF4826 domain-containing protein n=1 Tax=Desulfonema ishimotonii TaxID=45657 RepID=A0A401FV80_9BACT|nr:DUF4826 family protein [Desulfonema ishimotonii]GBC60882.1 DUF4826 domain-containing protein [Desulfonema ishimotonii]